MKKNTTILFIAAMAMLTIAGCSRQEDKVIATYGNGQPKLVQTLKGKKDKQQRIAEKAYYEDGGLMYSQHYKDDKPNGKWEYYYADGTLFASGNFSQDHEKGTEWSFFDAKGEPLCSSQYDSLVVMQSTADHRPLTISYYMGNDEMRYQFNENYTLNAKGLVRDGKKEGRWEFYYANGKKQMEALYKNDIPEGAYNSYRETGIPYFLGFYINGKRAGIWEFYDAEGNLAGTQNFDS